VGCEVTWSSTGLPLYQQAGVPSFNCQNTTQDYTNPTSFGIFPSSAEHVSAARYLCTLPSVKTVVYIAQANPQEEVTEPKALNPVFAGCGKHIAFVWFPYTAVDESPYILKAPRRPPKP
jgi:hypothetical protein